ncbi:DNA-binding response regulator [Flavobacterium sediminis]|uniref:DNA-binding response regulator n=1 Tax=Flavobacterium sediminis TaxID=2201181 RepID=A0A2U8QS01_9FLAO|nr:LytTR family DNA-binding domain-containing protein [Flavobacterium sediminis]AWM12646.1 DNA-binding response regulator [Flavobacterium sediminis]
MKIIIIEDEALLAQELATTLKSINNTIEIEVILESVQEAKTYFQNHPRPDLIFSDIQLGDGLSFEIIKDENIKTPVIFCTAYDDYAIEAFKASGIEYILKPFSKQTLEIALLKFEHLKEHITSNMIQKYEAVQGNLQKVNNTKKSFVINYRGRFLPVSLDKIAMFYLENEVNCVQLFTGKVYYIPNSLEEVEQKVDDNFFRVNRQFLINKMAIQEAIEHFPRKLKIQLTFPFEKEIVVSKEKKTKLLRWLSGK